MSVFLYAFYSINWLLVLVFALICYLFSFVVIQLRVEKFIYRRVKKIYDDLTLLESASLTRGAITTDMGTLTEEIDKFARDKKLEIETLKVREQYRKEFLGNVSHELRTPLTVINGYLEMLVDADVNPGVMRAVRQMGEQSDRMKSLVNDLLHLSKLESNNAGIGSDWFEFQSLCAMGVDQLRGYIPKSLTGEKIPEANIECECASNIEILGFAEEINSVLTNLLTNAIKYGRKEGQAAQIKIGIHSSNKGLEISVADEGDGIAPNHLSRLTERFYRVDESRESTVGGSGLGLAIVGRICKKWPAHMRFEKNTPQGTKVCVVLRDVEL